MAYQLASADIAHALDALASEHERIARALAQVGYPEERRRDHSFATLARIGVGDEQLPGLAKELSSILDFVEQLNELDTQGVKPLTSAVEATMRMREDVVTDGGYPDAILANAPERDDDYFAVPKVVE